MFDIRLLAFPWSWSPCRCRCGVITAAAFACCIKWMQDAKMQSADGKRSGILWGARKRLCLPKKPANPKKKWLFDTHNFFAGFGAVITELPPLKIRFSTCRQGLTMTTMTGYNGWVTTATPLRCCCVKMVIELGKRTWLAEDGREKGDRSGYLGRTLGRMWSLKIQFDGDEKRRKHRKSRSAGRSPGTYLPASSPVCSLR